MENEESLVVKILEEDRKSQEKFREEVKDLVQALDQRIGKLEVLKHYAVGFLAGLTFLVTVGWNIVKYAAEHLWPK